MDPDDAPEWTDADFARAVAFKGGETVQEVVRAVRRGRPKSERPKRLVTLRLDPDVVDRFKAGGAGWQSRINEALRRAAGLPRVKDVRNNRTVTQIHKHKRHVV